MPEDQFDCDHRQAEEHPGKKPQKRALRRFGRGFPQDLSQHQAAQHDGSGTQGPPGRFGRLETPNRGDQGPQNERRQEERRPARRLRQPAAFLVAGNGERQQCGEQQHDHALGGDQRDHWQKKTKD